MNHNPAKYVALLLLWAMIGACTDFGSAGVQHTDTQLSVATPEGVKDLQIVSQKVQVTNLSTGTTTTLTTLDHLTLPEGLYDVVYSADVTYTAQSSYDETAQAHGRLTGKAENVQVTGTTTHVKIDTYLSAETDDFIFEEIFFSGTLRSSGLQYYGDSYIKIYNNTDHVLYADGLFEPMNNRNHRVP